jgi:glycosyltransferase involved in cell wall biosynthesis
MSNRLSVVIAVKNEEKNIRDCLEGVKWADEIVIVDDVSSDKTVEISRGYTQNIFFDDSHGNFHKNKNLGLDKALGDWILSLDADERVTVELAAEIRDAIIKDGKKGYYILRKNYFLGKWIKGCGWWPDNIIRLFKKGAAEWPLEIHAVPAIKDENAVGYLKNPLIHYSYRSLNQYFEKFNRYTSRIAQEEFDKGVRIGGGNFFMYFLMKPLFNFFRKYILRKGFRDGFRGLFISCSSALVIFTTYAKLWEKQNAGKD